MPSYPLTALVLRKTKLGETDVILTLLAQDGRQVRAVAKGLRKPGSKFGARLEPYAVVDLLLHTGKSLEIVAEARTVATNAALREDLDRSMAAAVVADLLDKVSVEGQVEARLFALATTTLGVMDTCEVEALKALVVAFLLKAMSMHGYRPQLDVCSSCAGTPATQAFSLVQGGVLCAACESLDPSALRFPDELREWLRFLLGSTMSAIAADPPPTDAVSDSFSFVRGFVAYHLPSRLKALDYYAALPD